MTMLRNYKSKALGAVHEMMEGFHQSGAIGKDAMREFDEACLAPRPPNPAKTTSRRSPRKSRSP